MTTTGNRDIRAIPTRYRDTQFRSRTEARWSCFFDYLGWEWEYEPLDLRGYIPDFIVRFPFAPVLFEVKPAVTLADLYEYTAKIDQSGWDREAVIVGATLMTDPESYYDAIGLMSYRYETPTGDDIEWSTCLIHRCTECGKPSIHHATGGWNCRYCGKHDGKHYLSKLYEVKELWRKAGNEMQWIPKGDVA